MLIKASSLAIALCGVATFAQAADNLIISEYVEGSGNNKAVELYNPTQHPLDLSLYQLQFYFNGSTSAGSTIALSGMLAAGETHVVADDEADTDILVVSDTLSDVSFFNGDDAIVLSQQGQVIDSLGQVGSDPGSQWGSGLLSTQDNTLRRDINNLLADVIIDDDVTLSHWIGYAKDDISDLGVFGATTPPDPTDPDEPLACYTPATPIHQIQGSGDSSPLNGQQVIVEAIVTSNQASGLKGLFLQMADNEADNDVNTSEGVFAYTAGALAYASGDRIRLKATVKEYNGLTELIDISSHLLCATAQPIPSAARVTLPVVSTSQLEAFEGMLVTFSHNLVVNEVYDLGRYGEVLLGSQRHYIGTQVAAPGADALAVTAANALDRIILDDGLTGQNPDPIRYPAPGLSASNTLRVGDTLTGLTAVMHYGFGEYRLMPVETVNFVTSNPRSDAPQLALGGDLTVASFNVLNYFNGDGNGGGFPTARGANTLEEFERQSIKIVNAMVAMDADIIGLMEIENDGFTPDSAIADLVNGLNQALGESRYQYIQTQSGNIGSDAITVGLLYRSDKVSPVGSAQVLSSSNSPLDDNGAPLFNEMKNRPMLTQQFVATNSEQNLVVAVNHLKSKGSDCLSLGDPDLNDGQGNCNLTRTRAAKAIGQWLKQQYPQLPTLVIGDLNAYAKEDPLTTLADAGFNELFAHLGKTGAYSYIFAGETGQLDHALANEALLDKVIDITGWHINTDEPKVLDYNQEFKSASQLSSLFSEDAYRSSDHDPVVVSLLLAAENSAPEARFTYSVKGKTVTLVSTATDADGEIVASEWDLGNGDTATGEEVTYRYVRHGDYTVTLTVTDNAGLQHSTTKVVSTKGGGKNQPPVAVIEHIDLWLVDLFLSKSYDSDGFITRLQWQFDNGRRQSGPVAFSFAGAASKVKLQVTDNDGLKGKAKVAF